MSDHLTKEQRHRNMVATLNHIHMEDCIRPYKAKEEPMMIVAEDMTEYKVSDK